MRERARGVAARNEGFLALHPSARWGPGGARNDNEEPKRRGGARKADPSSHKANALLGMTPGGEDAQDAERGREGGGKFG
jgi:hypothetical protein